MRLTKQRKAYVAVLGLGLGALVVDRLFLGGASAPSSATAAPDSASAEAPSVATTEKPTPGAAGRDGGPRLLAANLERIRPAAPGQRPWSPVAWTTYSSLTGPGLFTTSADWLGRSAKVQAPSAPSAAKESMKEILGRHHVSTVVFAGRRSVVMIDGKPHSLGDVVDGLKITSIEQGAVTFESAGEQVRVDLVKAITDR